MPEIDSTLCNDHLVTFYDGEDHLIDEVATFFASGEPDAALIAVATPEHQRRLRRLAPRALFLDADEVLARFFRGGVIDAAAFASEVGALIRAAASDGSTVRVFGEMVALLWQRGLVSQAIELEALWTALGETLPFTLLCAYPSSLVLDHDDPGQVNNVCDLHNRSATRAFSATHHSVGDARRFVARCVEGAPTDQADRVLLVVSELATNAVRHAHTSFVVGVQLVDATVVVSVRDRSNAGTGLTAVASEPSSETGRGLVLVDALCAHWGVRSTPNGKSVWAQVR